MEQTNNPIAQTATDFLKALDDAGKQLANFSQELAEKNQSVFTILQEFTNKAKTLDEEILKNTHGENKVTKALKRTVDNLRDTVEGWNQGIQKEAKGRAFMHDHEKYMAVMVFGAVKAGKSTLGNFIAGREWLGASFDNVYKHLPPTEFATQEKGRDTGDIEKKDGRTWFQEGLTDTTGDIQYFTLSGLRWFDSPGTGAVEKQGDQRNMEEMVNEYLPYVDLCVFLINSAEPGLMEDMKYMKKLSRQGQEALIVITKSDATEEDIDDDGEIVQKLIPKTPENRKLQEDDMCKRLGELYPDINKEKFHAISISSALAQKALQENDAQKFHDSGLDVFIKKLQAKAEKDVVKQKEAGPKRAMNKFLTDIIKGDEKMQGLKKLQEGLKSISARADEYRKDIKDKEAKVTKDIIRKLERISKKEIRAMATTGEEASQASIAKRLFEIAQPVFAEEINRELSKILGAEEVFTKQMADGMTKLELKTEGLKKETKEITTEFTEEYYVEPEGVWEHVKDWVGRYDGWHTRTRKFTTKLDLGITNVDEVIKKLMPQMKEYAEKEVKTNLERIENEYFAPQETYAKEMLEAANKLQERLEALRMK